MDRVMNTTAHRIAIPDITSASGPYVVDASGKKYVDLESGTWCTVLGHSHPAVSRVIADRSAGFMHAGFNYSATIVQEVADKVLSLTGEPDGGCVFLCSGSEAIEISRQIARYLSGNEVSMTLHDSYLGAYSSVSDRRRGWFQFDWTRCADCRRAACDHDCPLLREIPDELSDFVFEPGSSSGFVRFPPVALIKRLVEIVHEAGGYVIANEVTTGTGRTGRWFGYEHYGVRPDMVAIGKGIGNGYPVSVAALSEAVADRLASGGFKYAQSHQNDPLGAAVVGTVIDTITSDQLIERGARLGEGLLARIETLVDGEIVTGVRGRGMMLCVDICDSATSAALHSELIGRGYLVGNRGSAFRIDPPLTIDESLLDEFVGAFDAAIDSVRASRNATG